jgi:hypothetical protein
MPLRDEMRLCENPFDLTVQFEFELTAASNEEGELNAG